MKKLFFASAVLFAFCLTSCKKDYTCVCKEAGVTFGTYTIKTTKKKSKDLCEDNEAQWIALGYTTVSCDIQ